MRRTPAIRREKLLSFLRQKTRHRIRDLAARAGTSEATLHRDLDMLQREGHIRKSYGCVEVLGAQPVFLEYQKRTTQQAERKRAIARKALECVQPGDQLFLDASSTCYYLAEAIVRSASGGALDGVTLVTNSVHLLSLCCRQDLPIAVISTGGQFDPALNAFFGELVAESLPRMRFHKAFVSGAGFSLAGGLTTTSDRIFGLLRAVMPLSAETYCLVDSSKCGRDCLLHVTALQAFGAVITNDDIDPSIRDAMREAGVPLVLAEAGESKSEAKP